VPSSLVAPKFGVKIDGNDVANLNPPLTSFIVSIDVESSMALPDSMVVEFHDPQRKVLEDAGIQIGSTLEISASYEGGSDSETTLASGEITALEAHFGPEGSTTVVRGLDKAHQLSKGQKTMAYQQMTASDVVSQLASDGGLSVGQIDSTSTTFPVVTQASQSDWDFIQQLAQESNRIAYSQQGQLYFVKHPDTSSAPKPPDDINESLQPLQLVLGRNLHRLDATVSGTEQVSSIEMRGWDPDNKQALVGTAEAGTSMMSAGSSPDELAGLFGGKTFTATHLPINMQGHADDAAAGLAERLSQASVEIHGECDGMPELVAGTAVCLAMCGDPFDGKYVVSSARHVFDTLSGYRTQFTVSGHRDGSAGGLAGATAGHKVRPQIHGVVTGIVSSTQDPNNTGMVQLQFPWLDDDYVSDWCRVVQIGAGSGWGNILMPEPNSEVLVAFDQGDMRKPYVLGGLYNGQDAITPNTDDAPDLVNSGTGAIDQRLYMSRTGHFLVFSDSSSQPIIHLQSADGNHQLKFDSSSSPGMVTLSSTGSVTITGSQNITISAQQDLTINAGQNITMSAAQNITISAGTGLTIKSQQVTVSAGATLTISSNGTASLTASATLDLSGSMTSINS
jgi:adhesin HecA-like repeat protein